MAKLTKEEVEHIAKLSKLRLTSAENELYREQLSGILEHVEQLSKVDTDKTEITANVTGLKNITREDKIVDSHISCDDIAKNAPKFNGDSFVVPGIFSSNKDEE
jgi:aspartyl-tRNA(Asn)/glutamyl-tRNA(Gln) amidotransferase subunit C